MVGVKACNPQDLKMLAHTAVDAAQYSTQRLSRSFQRNYSVEHLVGAAAPLAAPLLPTSFSALPAPFFRRRPALITYASDCSSRHLTTSLHAHRPHAALCGPQGAGRNSQAAQQFGAKVSFDGRLRNPLRKRDSCCHKVMGWFLG